MNEPSPPDRSSSDDDQGFPSPEATEFAFYAAIEAADPDGMRRVWEPGEACTCVHPLGPRLQGRPQVLEGWKRIFGSGTRLRFTIGSVRELDGGELRVRLVQEHITVLDADEQPAQPVDPRQQLRLERQRWVEQRDHRCRGPARDGRLRAARAVAATHRFDAGRAGPGTRAVRLRRRLRDRALGVTEVAGDRDQAHGVDHDWRATIGRPATERPITQA